MAHAYRAAGTTLLIGCGTSSGGPSGREGAPSTSQSGGASGNGKPSSTASDAGTTAFGCVSDAAPAALLQVPAGDFIMGCNDKVDTECDDDEKPMHTVSLSAFEIDRTEATQDQYAACVASHACAPPSCDWDCSKGELPAQCIKRDQAEAYCSWAGKRLATEAEWEKAARGTDGRKFPWGNDAPDCSRVNMASCGDVAAVVGSHPGGASPYGALDMAGNVVEIVADWYDAKYYAASPPTDPKGPASGTRYVGRGGGYKSEAVWQRSSKRDWYDLTDAGAALGFRCAR